MKIKKQSNRLFAFLMALVLIFGSVQMPQMVYAEEPAEATTVEDEQAVVEEPAVVEDSEEAQTTDEQAVTEPEIVEEAQETEPAEEIEIIEPVAEDELNVDQAAIDIELEEKEDLVTSAPTEEGLYIIDHVYDDKDNPIEFDPDDLANINPDDWRAESYDMDLYSRSLMFVYFSGTNYEIVDLNDLTFTNKTNSNDVSDNVKQLSDYIYINNTEQSNQIIDLCFPDKGTYEVSYKDQSISIEVNQPRMGFYAGNNLVSGLLKDGIEYKGSPVPFYLIFDGTDIKPSDIEFKNPSTGKYNTGEPSMTEPGFTVEKVPTNSKAFKITYNGSLEMGEEIWPVVYARIKINNHYEYEERDIRVYYPQREKGLFASCSIKWNDSTGEPVGVWEDSYCVKITGMELGYTTFAFQTREGNTETPVAANKLKLYYNGNEAKEECSATDNGNFVEIKFNRCGTYTVKLDDQLDNPDYAVTIDVKLPVIGFYTEPTAKDTAYLTDLDYDMTKGATFYLITNPAWKAGYKLESNDDNSESWIFEGYEDQGNPPAGEPKFTDSWMYDNNDVRMEATATKGVYKITLTGLVENTNFRVKILATHNYIDEDDKPQTDKNENYRETNINIHAFDEENGLFVYDWIEYDAVSAVNSDDKYPYTIHKEDDGRDTARSVTEADLFGRAFSFVYKKNGSIKKTVTQYEISKMTLSYYENSKWTPVTDESVAEIMEVDYPSEGIKDENGGLLTAPNDILYANFHKTGFFRVGYTPDGEEKEVFVTVAVTYPEMEFYQSQNGDDLIGDWYEYCSLETLKPIYLRLNNKTRSRFRNIKVQAGHWEENDSGESVFVNEGLITSTKLSNGDYKISFGSRAANDFVIFVEFEKYFDEYEDENGDIVQARWEKDCKELRADDIFERWMAQDEDTRDKSGFSAYFISQETYRNPSISWSELDRSTQPLYFAHGSSIQEAIKNLVDDVAKGKTITFSTGEGSSKKDYPIKVVNTGYISIDIDYNETNPDYVANVEAVQNITDIPASIKGIALDCNTTGYVVKHTNGNLYVLEEFTNGSDHKYVYNIADEGEKAEYYEAEWDDTKKCYVSTGTQPDLKTAGYEPTKDHDDEGNEWQVFPQKQVFWPQTVNIDVTADVIMQGRWPEASTVNLRFVNKDAKCKIADTEFTLNSANATAKWDIDSDHYEIAVTCKKPTALQIKTAPTKTTYTEGEAFSPAGMVVELVYADGVKKAISVSNCTVLPNGALKTTDTAITVTYGKFTVKQAIKVNAKTTSVNTEIKDSGNNKGNFKVTNSGTVDANGKVQDATVVYTKAENPGKETTVKIPDTIKDENGVEYKVTSIDANAFKNDKKLKTVTIGKNVETIGDNAFNGCKELKTVKISDNVTSIGKNAFSKCEKLKSISITKNVKSIGANAFKGCKNLKKITIKSEGLTQKDLKALKKSIGKNKVTIKVPKKVKTKYKNWLKGINGKVS